MARDPERIARITLKLAAAWLADPDARLCQLVSNVAAVGGVTGDTYYLEDDRFEASLDEYVRRMGT